MEGDPTGRPTRLPQRVVVTSCHAAPAPSAVLVLCALSLPAAVGTRQGAVTLGRPSRPGAVLRGCG